jgi:hypothetical protein
MIEVKVVGPGAAFTHYGKMLDSGVIIYDGGRISHVISDIAKGQSVYRFTKKPEVIEPPVVIEPPAEEEIPKQEIKLMSMVEKPAKRGRKPKNESGN